jgi:hypothetical protein
MSVDLRTRRDDPHTPFDPEAFFTTTLPGAAAVWRHAATVGRCARAPLALTVDGDTWSLALDTGRVDVRHLAMPPGDAFAISGAELADLVHDRSTPVTLYTSGRLARAGALLPDLLDWWLVLRSILDDRPIHTPGAVGFSGRDGGPLDLARSFALDDDPDEMSHFLHEAGFLHLRGVFGDDEMAAIGADMESAAPAYREGDGRSWWASTADGKRRLVRMQAFDEHSTTARALLDDERFLRLGAIPGDGHVHTGLPGNRIEALFKPIGVVQGISDVPWHKDCSLGRHSYDCCSLTVGVSVTGAGAGSGQLRVMAGSHRALVWPAIVSSGQYDLPEVALPTRTGDATIHLSCTLHMAEPPVERERKVMYTSFRLPVAETVDVEAARAAIRVVREGAHTIVSQAPGHRGSVRPTLRDA